MKLMNTACLAALLLACPLAATAVHGAEDYDVHYTEQETETGSGIVESSNNKDQKPSGIYKRILLGHAFSRTASIRVESDNNEGILGAGLTVEGYQVYGGWAQSSTAATVQANWNTITLQNGVNFTAPQPGIFGGYAIGSCNTEASNNTVIIGTDEEGFKGKLYEIKGGSASGEIKSESSDTVKALNNTVIIKKDFENSVEGRVLISSGTL